MRWPLRRSHRKAVWTARLAPRPTLALALALTLSMPSPAFAEEQFSRSVEPRVVTLKPFNAKIIKGEMSDDPLTVLSTDGGGNFAELSPGRGRFFIAMLEYRYPDGDLSRVKSVTVKINSRGEEWSQQRRFFHIRSKRKAPTRGGGLTRPGARPTRGRPQRGRRPGRRRKFRWVKVANNRDSKSWEWQSQVWTEEGGPNKDLGLLFSNAGIIRIRVKSNNAVNVMHLDYMVVDLHVDAAPATSGSWWKPQASSRLTWQWQLTGTVDQSFDVDVYDIDLFDNSPEVIRELQGKGRRVVCYFSAGSYEDWRHDWLEFFPGGTSTMPLAGEMDDWDENYLDISRLDDLKPIMTARMELAKEKGCDGVEPDNMDAYSNGDETGLDLSYNDQLAYNRWVANVAHEFGLSVALKNDVEQVEDLVDYFDFAINEECFEWRECGRYKVFTDRDKAVFNAEYKGSPRQFCPKAEKIPMSSIKKKYALTEWRVGCEDVLAGKNNDDGGGKPVEGRSWWQPKASAGLTWQWQLQGTLDLSHDVDMYDVDLFDTDVEIIEELQGRGKIVVCYFSAGSYEDWRDDWDEYFPDGVDEVSGGKMGEWDELWLDIRKIDKLEPIMTSRLQLAREKGCNGVEPDNVDGYSNGDETKLPMTYDDQLAYNRMIARKAHDLGLSVALKNDVEQIDDLEPDYDFAVNEQCHQHRECGLYKRFTDRDKAVFGVEYDMEKKDFCPEARANKLSWMKKKVDLKEWRDAC